MVDFPHKIVVPTRPPELVSRQRLLLQIGQIVDRRLVIVVAPAGYGKTSLLVDYVTAPHPLPVCWYALDRFDEDPWVFLAYLASAIAQQFPGALHQTQTLLESSTAIPFATVAASLVREVYAITRDFALVIDDWHHVDNVESCTELIEKLLLYCPRCHVVLATRSYPSLSDLMVLANRRQLSGLDEEHMRFTAAELATVLADGYQTPLPPEQVDQLTAQSSGWITGVLLALQVTGAASGSRGHETQAVRQIYSFLAEQVFEQQTAELQSFLLDAALLEELTAGRCALVLGRSDASPLLEQLLRQHVFVSEIGPGTLRFHPLFREFLQEQFRLRDPERFKLLAGRVAAEYLAQGQWQLAFDTYIGADDRRGAQQVAERGGASLYAIGRLETLERWFAALPLDDLSVPLLCLKARVLLERGHHHKAHVVATMAAACMRPAEQPQVLLLQAQIVHIMGEYDQAVEHAEHVLRISYDAAERATALRTLGICHQRQHATAQAIAELNQALALQRARGDLAALAQLHHDLGVCYEHLGVLHMAEEYYSFADAHWAMIGNRGLQAMSLNSKAVVQHVGGRYREAYATLRSALAYADEASMPRYQATALVSLGDLLADLQCWSAATAAYDQAALLGGSAFIMSYLDVARVRLLVRQRRFDAAANLLRQLPPVAATRHSDDVLLLRAQIACGQGSVGEAEALIGDAIRCFEAGNAQMNLARAYALRGHLLARNAPDQPWGFVEAFEQTRRIAERLGHDAFVISETMPFRHSVRQAQAAGWERGGAWLQQYHALEVEAEAIAPHDERPVLAVRTLGADQIAIDGMPLDIGWNNAREVLYHLLMHPDGSTPEVLREAIWPHLTPERSRSTLKNAIFQLRSRLPQGALDLHRRQAYRIDGSVVRINHDVQRFLTLLGAAGSDPERYLDALDLYGGPFLPRSESHWCQSMRSALHHRYIGALRQVAQHFEHRGAYGEALAQWQRYLADEPLDEAAHTGVMRCQLGVGNRAAAVQQYQRLRELLYSELGLDLDPASEAEELYHQLLHHS